MRYLHPVQAHERFIASGTYRFSKNGAALAKTEIWALHAHADGETFVRVDADARQEEGKSILAEALIDREKAIVRFDIRYENSKFEGGIRALRATYQRADDHLQIGYSMNGDERKYTEIELPAGAIIDVPLLFFRGRTIRALAERANDRTTMYVPMFEHAQLCPGVLQHNVPPVVRDGDYSLSLGKRVISASRFRYLDKAVTYWLDPHDVIVKRLNSFKQQEIAVEISNYAAPPG